MTALRHPVAFVRGALRDPLLANSWLMLATTVLMAAAGGVFWVIAARIATPRDVGLASSLVTAGEALAVLAQLGLNISMVRVLQRSDRRSADVLMAVAVVSAAGVLAALAYVALLPRVAPDLAALISWPWTALLFAVLVAGAGVNQLTDGLFLAIDRVSRNLVISGVLMGLVKCALPFVLVGSGALGLYNSVGIATLVAAVLSVASILRFLPDRTWQLPSAAFRHSRGFARAGYVANNLYLLPQMVFPLLIINGVGPASSAHYFVGFQIVTLLNSVVYAISNSMYAESSRHPERVTAIVRQAGRHIAIFSGLGIVGLLVLSPLLLRVFGAEYAENGTTTLRILTLGTVGVALNFWSAIRLRIAQHQSAMVVVQLVTTVAMVGAAALLVGRGIEFVALAWGGGHLLGGLLGYTVSRRFAPLRDTEPDLPVTQTIPPVVAR
ncbi:Membrane protein involved in the export of O-antigen and teichoic acid [Nocardioides scoriae]|uniref:Membrane protein involved in the export of O-antigen and teichoic acid n=1 Tax=Nocardioides scoriae TaxID=642780 RepID=A0A1H1X084_9ACTN|nr:hypothetical protein [Nocardioides scoriae]SDT02757.1 Membrane protein involved in the export of O-antigen and teichoic acid [Nocardioides scoriae]